MSTIAIIPARMGSSRFPGKPLALLHNMPMLGHVALRVKLVMSLAPHLLQGVYVATCDEIIAAYCKEIDIPCIMTSASHDRCTDRVAEALQYIEAEKGHNVENVLLVQGDEPMVTPSMIKAALTPLAHDDSVQVVNLMAEIASYEEWQSPNTIKVVVDRNDNALYFSRAALGPLQSALQKNSEGHKLKSAPKHVFKQVCIMPFRRDFLLHFLQLEETDLERQESIDMLRLLEHGHKVRMVKIFEHTQSVDTPQDLALVHELMQGDALMHSYRNVCKK